MADYKVLAQQQLDPVLNQKIQALKNAANTSRQSLDQSKAGINTNYDQQNEDQNMQNNINKNNISNSALGRGLGRSSIVTSGLGEADMVNTKFLDRLKTARTGALNNIEQQKSLIDTNTANTISQMQSDYQNEAATLARELEDRDWQKSFQERQFNAEQAYKAQQLAQAKANAEAKASNAKVNISKDPYENDNQKNIYSFYNDKKLSYGEKMDTLSQVSNDKGYSQEDRDYADRMRQALRSKQYYDAAYANYRGGY